MNPFLLTVLILGGLLVLLLTISFVCFCMTFLVHKEKPLKEGETDLPQGDIYKPFWPQFTAWALETRSLPCEEVSIRSFDGLTLYGYYYEYAPGAPVEIMFHGYRGTRERDLSGAVQRCFRLKRNALLVDQRGSGKSGGKVITFGVREQKDCLAWTDFVCRRFGPNVKILLTGISMGASTVLSVADAPLPPNVVGILADCGFSSAKEVIGHVIREMGLPPKLLYPFVKAGAKLFGGFNVEEHPPLAAMKNSRLPILFFHGDSDDFVPCSMSRDNYEACVSRKRLCVVRGAGHGLSYTVDPSAYYEALNGFFEGL